MNTRPIPIVLALAAAGMTCIISIVQKVSFGIFLLRLFVVVVLFYLLGIFVGILFLEALGPEKKPKDEEEAGEQDGSVALSGAEGEDSAGERPEELEDVTADGGADETDEEPFADDDE